LEVALSLYRKAFTLIELLVVIAIIAILAAILFPVFAQAKAAAKSAVTLSNMKQTGTATLLYEGDSDDMCLMPYNYEDGAHYYGGMTSVQRLYPYSKSYAIQWDATGPVVDSKTVSMDLAAAKAFWDANGGWYGTWQPGTYWDWNTTISPNVHAFYYDSNFPADGGARLNSSGADMHVRSDSAQEFPAEQSRYASIRADGYGENGALRYVAFYATCPDPKNSNYWQNMWYSASKKHSNSFVSSFTDGHAKKVPLWSVAQQNCTYNSASYNAFIQTPKVAHFISVPNSPTQ